MLTDPTVGIMSAGFGESDNFGAFYVYTDYSVENDLLVAYTVTAGTATPGVDFELPSGFVTIPAGDNTAEIFVTIYDDFEEEGNETFIIDIVDVSEGTVQSGSAVATIYDNESPTQISIVSATFDESDGFGTFFVISDTYPEFDLNVSYEVQGTCR